MHKKLCMVLVGAPCSGKSTIGKATAEEFGESAVYISSGDIARSIASRNATVQKNLADGMLAPESQMRGTLNERIWNEVILRDKQILILDGFPRFGEQAEWLENLLKGRFNIKYVLIDTPADVLRNRARNRSRDDDRTSFEKRLVYYNETTLPELISRITYRIYCGYSSNDTYVQILTRMCKEVLREERWT